MTLLVCGGMGWMGSVVDASAFAPVLTPENPCAAEILSGVIVRATPDDEGGTLGLKQRTFSMVPTAGVSTARACSQTLYEQAGSALGFHTAQLVMLTGNLRWRLKLETWDYLRRATPAREGTPQCTIESERRTFRRGHARAKVVRSTPTLAHSDLPAIADCLEAAEQSALSSRRVVKTRVVFDDVWVHVSGLVVPNGRLRR